MMLTTPLIAHDTPLADRFHALVEESEALTRQMDDALAAHRADCFRRYGHDWRHSDFTAGPDNPLIER